MRQEHTKRIASKNQARPIITTAALLLFAMLAVSSCAAAVENEREFACTLTVECKAALDNKEKLSAQKLEILPDDGILFEKKEVTFKQGQTALDVLKTQTRLAGIPMEFIVFPLQNSAYIKGIGNLYEFDCGALSGWLYKVNGVFPDNSCSQYLLRENDEIAFVYSCDLGRDIGSGGDAEQK